MRYHVNSKGEAGVCRAKKTCPFGDLESDHYSSPEEARQAYEQEMAQATFPRPQATFLTNETLKQLDPTTRKTVVAAFKRLRMRGRSREELAYWQAVYDSTPAGALWLERKKSERHGATNPEVVERERNLQLLSEVTEEHDLTLPEVSTDVFQQEFHGEEPVTFARSGESEAQKETLALASATWMANLTPEEIEAVSWLTSNGSSVVNQHLAGQEPEIWGYDVYSREHIDRQVELFRSAMAKAPELEEPVIIYRGTTADNLYLDQLDAPASSSVAGSVATGFTNGEGERVLLEIKTKKLPAVVGMSVWGVRELEVLAPLGRYSKVGDFQAMRGSRPDLDPQFDTLRVIQVEYLGP